MDASEDYELKLENEIERKAVETLKWLIEIRDVANESEFNLAASVFQMITRGLIDSDINNAVDEMISDHYASPSLTEILVNTKDPSRILMMTLRAKECAVHCHPFQGKTRIEEFETPEQARDYFSKVLTAFCKKHYQSLLNGGDRNV